MDESAKVQKESNRKEVLEILACSGCRGIVLIGE
jgi:hypothetical protein